MNEFKILRCRMCLLVLVLPLSLLFLGGSQGGDAKTDKDFYYEAGKKVPVIVALDQIGIVTRQGVKAKSLANMLAGMKLRMVREYHGTDTDMAIVELPKPLGRQAMLKLARDIKKQGGKDTQVSEAGMLVTPAKAKVPLLVTHEFVVLFKANVTRKQIDEFNKTHKVEVVRPDRFVKNQFLLRVTEDSETDTLHMANRYHDSDLVSFAHPNFGTQHELFETIPNDPLFGNQWHHRNTGQNGGTVGADARTSLAWDFTMGSPNVIIAIVDNGFDMDHEDLAPNLFTNAGEIAGNGKDDDGNGFIDDVNGWDFGGNDNNPRPATATDNHGTAVAGVAVARGNNKLGVCGAAPNCRFMPVRLSFSTLTNQQTADIFGYIQDMASRTKGTRWIINNSWGHTDPAATVPDVVRNAINSAADAGLIIFFSAGNSNTAGWCAGSYPSLAKVISVSSSSNLDRKVIGHAFGNCIDILAPTRWSPNDMPKPTGTLAITTTDRTGKAGYNSDNPSCIGGLTEPADTKYTNCFSGTSSASPLAAGIGALVLSANSKLTRVQVQRLLQDTADKIEPSVGAYADTTGFSTPASGIATHSWGRVNAFEAVRIAAPVKAKGLSGRGGVDIFLRDNRLDWGNTDQPSNTLFEPVRGFIPHWQSVDIKVDAPPLAAAPTTSAAFDVFVDQKPISGKKNRVYVRVHNRGPEAANSVTVNLYWAFAGLGLPSLPADFWTTFPSNSADTTKWHPLGSKTISGLKYSGASVAGGASDASQIVAFDFDGPKVDPKLPNHFCLLAIIDSPQDHVSAQSKASFVVDNITPTDNNVTHRNIAVETVAIGGSLEAKFFVRNPTLKELRAVLRLKSPKGWRIELEKVAFDQPFSLKPKQELLVSMKLTPAGGVPGGDVTITQEQADGATMGARPKVMGGMTYRLTTGKK